MEPMDCNSGQRKVFADEMVASVTELVEKYGLEDVVVHRDADPILVAARGCLKDETGEGDDQKIQFTLQISPDLKRAEERSLVGARVASEATGEVSRAFDLSEVVARETVAQAESREEEEC